MILDVFLIFTFGSKGGDHTLDLTVLEEEEEEEEEEAGVQSET